jgi:hypothetical protein
LKYPLSQPLIVIVPNLELSFIGKLAISGMELLLASRVTTLGEFSPSVRLLTLGIFLKIKEVAKIYAPLLFKAEIIK